MTDDLRRQASELYRKRSGGEPIPTSDSLSMKKIFYIAVGIMALLLIAVALFGGFRHRENAVIAANTPPPLAKEMPPADLLEPKLPVPLPTKTEPKPAETQPAPAVEQPRASVEAKKPAQPKRPAEERKPALKRDTATAPAPTRAPEPPPAPKLSEVEVARRETAKDIILEKNPALAQLVASPNSKGWNAEPDGTDQYLVTFSVVDESSGAPVQYVWRVNVSTRSITPLSYYARRLS